MHTVVFCTDENYIVPTYVAIFSLLKNYRGEELLNIYILSKEEFIYNCYKKLFYELESRFEFLHLYFKTVGSYFERVKIRTSYISTATMFRLLIPKLIDSEKCVYLDSDLVVEDDISHLFDIDMTGYCVAGVRDLSISKNIQSSHAKLLGIPTTENYIQAGVLLMNLKEIRRLGLDSKLIKIGSSKVFPYNDQDVLNLVFYGKIKNLDLCYNTVSLNIIRRDNALVEMYGRENVYKAKKKPVIFHYAGVRKPWGYKYMYGADNWWKYIRMQNEQVRELYIDLFFDKLTVPFFDQVREKIESLIKFVGLYPICKNIVVALSIRNR